MDPTRVLLDLPQGLLPTYDTRKTGPSPGYDTTIHNHYLDLAFYSKGRDRKQHTRVAHGNDRQTDRQKGRKEGRKERVAYVETTSNSLPPRISDLTVGFSRNLEQVFFKCCPASPSFVKIGSVLLLIGVHEFLPILSTFLERLG